MSSTPMDSVDTTAPADLAVQPRPIFSRLVPQRAPRSRTLRRGGQSFVVTFVAVIVVALFLSPLVRSFTLSLKSPEQVTELNAPIYPASPETFTYQGKQYDVYQVPIDGQTRDLALVKKGRESSQFVDPGNPAAGPITWNGSWRTLQAAWQLDPKWENYSNVWNEINYPRLLFNTIAIALITTIGVVLSCTLVAYGFARFRFPGRNALFMFVIATIFLPGAVTIIPTYTIFARIGWVGTWLPLLVPAFFANAYDVFLLRQYLMTIPREMDEAAAIDGAGPFRTLVSVILPQAWPVMIAVAIFTFVYTWNDFFGPLIYLSGHPDIQTLSVGLQAFSGARVSQDPGLIQAGVLMTLVIPVVLFLIFQRAFIRGIVITGVEK